MAEVSDITIKRTQDSLGKLILKPVLTDKLLRKPPFKFLHDIIRSVITTTGFLNGLYTDDELKSENIKDRDAKIAFLQKTIDALRIATKQDVRARPSKIVAGLEADKTNEFLIALAKAIDRKVDSSEAVALVKSGKVGDTQSKDTKTTKPAKPAKNDARRGSKDSKIPTAKKAKNSDGKALKKLDSSGKVTKQSSKESNDSKKPKSRSSSQNPDKEKEKNIDREKKISGKNDELENNAKPIEPNVDYSQMNGNGINTIDDQETKPNIVETAIEPPTKQIDLPNEKIDVKPDQPDEMAKSAQINDQKSTNKRVDEMLDNKMQNKPDENQMPKSGKLSEKKSKSQDNPTLNNISDKTNDKPRSSKLRKTKRDTEQISNDQVAAKPELKSSMSVDKLIERPLNDSSKPNDATKPPKTRASALRSAAARPISARPSAPRRRDRNVRQILHTENFVQDPNNNQNKANKKNALPEFDDADNIVITDAIQDNISILDETPTIHEEADIDGKQGHLVQQILETQTAILKADAKNDQSAITDESILNDRKSITRNMTELRKMIQKLSLYITPLGKMMEYFQEDVDAMQIELLMWQKAGAAAQSDIKEEQRTTEKLLENFKYQLAEINNSIKDHAEQINNTTMSIIQNEEKISKLIATL